jgi:hypothetical protein
MCNCCRIVIMVNGVSDESERLSRNRSNAERADVIRAMALLAEAATRRRAADRPTARRLTPK